MRYLTQEYPMPGTRPLLRISVFLPIASVFLLGLTNHWREAATPDSHVAALVAIAIIPLLVVYLPPLQHWLDSYHLPVALTVYLVCQTLLSSLLHNLGLVRFDLVQLGPVWLLEPGVLFIIPLLLIAWQYGWIGALLASAAAGTLHMLTGLLVHRLIPDAPNLAPITPILRPDMLYFLPLLVAYLGILLRRQLHQQAESQTQWREFAATAEVLAVERERKRLANLLQNTLGRSLSGLNDQLDGLAAALGSLPETAAEKLRRAQLQVRQDLQATQEVISDLQPAQLSELGLVEAIRQRADMLSQRRGVDVSFQASDLPDQMTSEQELVVYHVVDQALNHVGNHLGVQNVHLRLTAIEHFVALTVHDDGTCTCGAKGGGHEDLEDLETCTQLIGGHFCFDKQGDNGNTLALWLPCGRDK